MAHNLDAAGTRQFGGVKTAEEELHAAVEHFDPKIVRYARLRRTTDNLAASMRNKSYISPLMRDSTWTGGSWVRLSRFAVLEGLGTLFML